MNANEIQEILNLHQKWLNKEHDGVRANFSGQDLHRANLCEANLEGANLRYANLSLSILQGANLQTANLKDANLRYANLEGANLDFSSWPLRCGSFDVYADDRLVAQIACHLARLNVSRCSDTVREAIEKFRETSLADMFTRFRQDVSPIGKTSCESERLS